MRMCDLFDMEPLIEAPEDNMMTVSALKAQSGTKEKLDRFLSDYGLDESPDADELVVVLVAKEGLVPLDSFTRSNTAVYTVETSKWELTVEDGEFDNYMLVANFMSSEIEKIQEKYIQDMGVEEEFDPSDEEAEFTFVICSDVEEDVTLSDLAEMSISFNKYIPSITFQDVVVGQMSTDQFLQMSNGLPMIDDRET